jgi:hypothetical protein
VSYIGVTLAHEGESEYLRMLRLHETEPVEFREMGMAMHRAAADFARAASVPVEASGADWKRTVGALEDISAQCRACHSAFRVE